QRYTADLILPLHRPIGKTGMFKQRVRARIEVGEIARVKNNLRWIAISPFDLDFLTICQHACPSTFSNICSLFSVDREFRDKILSKSRLRQLDVGDQALLKVSRFVEVLVAAPAFQNGTRVRSGACPIPCWLGPGSSH